MAVGQYGGACVELHHAMIYDRGGKRRVAELVDLSDVRWDRRRDQTSEASIWIAGAGACAAQASTLEKIEPKRSELVLFRGEERVWEGPINRVGWHADRVEIAAKDISDYIFARPLSKVWDNSYNGGGVTQVTTRISEILAYELANPFTYESFAEDGTPTGTTTVPGWEQVDPPANILPYITAHHFSNEARTSAKTKAFEMSVGEHIDNMARTQGVDYTVVGRAFHVWDTSRFIGQTRVLTEADFFGEVIVTAYGSDFAAIAFAVAEDGTNGGAGKNSDYYGPWAKMFTIYNEDEANTPTVGELASQARRNLAGRSPVPIEVRIPDNSSVRLSPGLTIDMLVPGVQIPLRATLNARQTIQNQKIHQMSVRETPEGETISLTLLPATRPDAD